MSYKANVTNRRDQRIADEAAWPVDSHLMCPAVGCPNRWSVSGERGRGCTWHYWADPHDWPRITERLVRAETDRALYAACQRPESAPPPTYAERKAANEALAAFVQGRAVDPKAWARELQRRHEEKDGKPLRPDQIDAYRRVLRLDVGAA